MKNNALQRLVALESRDVVSNWFKRIHGRELNQKRAKEIISAAKQGREYYRNAEVAAYSVRALLEYYGTTCIGRSLTLLMLPDTGEAALARGHGLETVGWADALKSDEAPLLGLMGDLEVKIGSGAFTDFLTRTANTSNLHIFSSKVDISIPYGEILQGRTVKLNEILSRIPDLLQERMLSREQVACHGVNIAKDQQGNHLKLWNSPSESITLAYSKEGYLFDGNILRSSAEVAENFPEYLANSYIDNNSSSIPSVYLLEPFPGGARYSQLAVIYFASYFLGMLCRYFPTHWMALMNGEKGDVIWPQIHKVHAVIHETFPLLVMKFVEEKLDDMDKATAR